MRFEHHLVGGYVHYISPHIIIIIIIIIDDHVPFLRRQNVGYFFLRV